jgi:hypothetical protein
MREKSIYQVITVISKKEVENLWKEKSQEIIIAYPEDKIKEIIIDEEEYNEDYYIIYLSGVSMKKMISSNKFELEARFWHRPRYIKDKGPHGYYLVKLSRKEIEEIDPDEQDLLGLIPEGWRRAFNREALEIILNISLIAKRKAYKNSWHISKNKDVLNGKQIIPLFNLINFNKGTLTMATKTEERIPQKTNSITIMKLS